MRLVEGITPEAGLTDQLDGATRRTAAAVTHGTVAAEAGLPRSAVSHHVDSLDDLLAAALRSGTEQLVADVALAGLAAHHTDDPGKARAFAAGVDGYSLQYLATGAAPRVDHLRELLGLALTAAG